jgi:hypothetical protein
MWTIKLAGGTEKYVTWPFKIIYLALYSLFISLPERITYFWDAHVKWHEVRFPANFHWATARIVGTIAARNLLLRWIRDQI